MLKHIDWDGTPREQLNPQLERQFFNSGAFTIARLYMRKGLHIPTHHHPHEQVTTVVSGSLRMWIEGKVYDLHAGDVLCIPGNVPHDTDANEETVALYVFSPPRADWASGEGDDYLRRGVADGAARDIV